MPRVKTEPTASPKSQAASFKILLALAIIGAVWMLVLLRLGVWGATKNPRDGVLSHTFNSWAANPISRHYFLGQYDPNELPQGKAYTSYTYPFLFSNYFLVEPIHRLFKLPYNVAHNVIAHLYVVAIVLFLALATWTHLLAVLEEKRLLLAVFVFLAFGIVITNSLQWVGVLAYARDNFHVLAAMLFCYLSTFVFYERPSDTPFLVIGIVLALLGPMYLPAWILAGLFINRELVLKRDWIVRVLSVSVLAGINMKLPEWISGWAGLTSTGSGFPYRSGLDGSTIYLTNIYQAIFSPFIPRLWPTGLYVVTAALAAVAFHYWFRSEGYRPLQQAAFLLIPYATLAILLPQFTSIHPYFTDMLLIVPATFIIAFWSLQKEFWSQLTGNTFVAWVLLVALILMTNLLTVAQYFNGPLIQIQI